LYFEFYASVTIEVDYSPPTLAYRPIMTLLQAALLALVQGLTEFLPISSSAHLALAPWLLGWKDQGLAFDIALHFGTLLAVVLYFFRDWMQIVAQGFGVRWGGDPELDRHPRLLWLLALATVPVGVAGLLFEDKAETVLRKPLIIGGMLIGVGIVMYIADSIGRQKKRIGEVSLTDALWVGAAQALAIVPGTSRSGITIAAGLFRGMDRPSAARFSFLLSTPAVFAAAVKAFYDLHKHGGIPAGMGPAFALGIAFSAIAGCLAIAMLLRYLRVNSLRIFVYYRVIFGIIVVALAFFFRQQAE